jgi:N-dimethylarginine dimethylaminohydrolase
MKKKTWGGYWTDEELKEAIDEWRKGRPEKLKTGDWLVEDIPFYEPGRPPRVDLWHRIDYLDEYDLTYDKKWGASGIGKLKEMAVIRPTEQDFHIFEKQDPIFMRRPKLANLEKWQKEHDGMVQALRDEGVTVHYIEYPKPAIGPLGPIRGQWAGREAFVAWGGALVTRYGCWNPMNKGRERVLTEWLVNQGCPILLTVIGKGICETGTLYSFADDALVVGRGIAYNADGIEQIRPVLQRVGITTIVEAYMPGWVETLKGPIRGHYHPDEFFGVLDLGKVLIYPGSVDFEFIKWFRDRRFEIVEVDIDEHAKCYPANLITLEPGKVMMHAEAKKTIKKVQKAGIEVVEVPYEENICMGGGLNCATMELIRERGPRLEDIK